MAVLKELCLLLLIGAVFVSGDRNKKPYKVVCYLGSWANYRTGDAKFLIEHIDPNLCTHLIYGFAKLANNQIAVYDPYLDLKENWGLGAFGRFNGLKNSNPNLSTLIAIGGWNEGSTKYSNMAADPAARATFVKSCIDFCQKYGFDGVDMDWEYPANRGGVPADKQNFVTLLKEMKAAFEPHGLLLTAAVAAGKSTIDTAYDIPEISKSLDFINVMAYDLHGSWEKVTGHHAGLGARDEDSDEGKLLTVEYAMTYWKNQGCPAEKLVLGMGTYGRSFTLASADNNGLGAPTTGPGAAGGMTKEPGMLGYNEICLKVKEGWTEVFVPKLESPYAFGGNQWVGYDNKKSIETKVDYIIKQGYGGGMIWSLETDDFRGKCSNEKFPLLSAIYTKLNGAVERQTPSPEEKLTTTTQPIVRPTSNPGELFKCTADGYFRDPQDCSKFYLCVSQGNGEFARHTYSCGENLAFDENTKVCTYKKGIPGCN